MHPISMVMSVFLPFCFFSVLKYQFEGNPSVTPLSPPVKPAVAPEVELGCYSVGDNKRIACSGNIGVCEGLTNKECDIRLKEEKKLPKTLIVSNEEFDRVTKEKVEFEVPKALLTDPLTIVEHVRKEERAKCQAEKESTPSYKSTCPHTKGNYFTTCTNCEMNCTTKQMSCICKSDSGFKSQSYIKLSEKCYYRNIGGSLRCGFEDVPNAYITEF